MAQKDYYIEPNDYFLFVTEQEWIDIGKNLCDNMIASVLQKCTTNLLFDNPWWSFQKQKTLFSLQDFQIESGTLTKTTKPTGTSG